jgi:hypothetical protein
MHSNIIQVRLAAIKPGNIVRMMAKDGIGNVDWEQVQSRHLSKCRESLIFSFKGSWTWNWNYPRKHWNDLIEVRKSSRGRIKGY